ncbi:MAG: type 4a pilus biogenesis protein PilO [bacterium]|nr:type 4a pilus biogenesis protein PilO [bacterium]
MPELGSRYRSLLVLAAVALLAVSAYLIAHRPLLRELGELRGELDRQERLLERNRETARQVPLLEAEVAELKEASTALEQDLPVTRRSAELLQYLDESQRQAGVRVMALEFGDGEPVQNYVRYPVRFLVEGPFPGQTSFLGLVEKLPRLALVERVRLVPVEVPGRVEASYTLYVYVDERRPPTPADLEDLIFRRPPGRVNPFLTAP